MSNVGDTVVHEYSLHRGKVLSKRKNKLGYNYEVRFYMPENTESEKYRIDWFKRSVLREVQS